ncbi:hypothetical protein Tco_1547267 [Tanacetum coccineum]
MFSLVYVMPPRIRTRSAGRPTGESLGGGTGERVGSVGRGRRPREGNDERVDELNGQGNDQGMGANEGVEGVNGNVERANGGAPDFSTIIALQLQNLLPAMLARVSNRGNVGNQNGNVVNENVQENVGNVLVNGNRVGCSYKEFLACNPKEYDGKGGVVVLTCWIKKMEYVHDMSGCSIDQKVKYTAGSFVESCPNHEMQKLESELWNHAMVRAGHATYTDRFYELARLVSHLIFGALTDEAVRNGSIKKVEKRGNVGEPSKDRSGRDDNKRTRKREYGYLAQEKDQKKARLLMSAKASEKKQEEIVVVRDFPEPSYVDKRRKPLEFSVGNYVLLKVSPWKGVVRFEKKWKLAPRFVGPFKIVEKVGPVAYQFNLPGELNGVHDTFHVSNLKKCLADPTLQVPSDEIEVPAFV